jgi:hypothetical protein
MRLLGDLPLFPHILLAFTIILLTSTLSLLIRDVLIRATIISQGGQQLIHTVRDGSNDTRSLH